ncbi:MAG: flagellar biosynthetic protein FliO [Nitrospirae bacterium]|nr:flagellar biosynthetic protein FliO [Nitrospirota bacterium]
MKRILSVMTLLTLLPALHQSAAARPANLVMLNDVKIATSVDNTKIELMFDEKPEHEKILYRNEFIQVEIPEAYTDPPKQWLKVEDEIVKNIFIYQFDENTVRIRLFAYGNAVNLKDRVSISRDNNGLIISYDQQPPAVNKKTPAAVKVNTGKRLNKNAIPPEKIKLPVTIEQVPPAQIEPIESSDVAAANTNENQGEVLSGQSHAEAVTGLLKTDGLQPDQHIDEDKPHLLKDPPGFTGSFIKMVTALGIVLSLLFAIVYLVKKYLGKKIGLSGQDQKIRVVTSTYLGPKKSIALVEIAGEKIVVGVTATHISMLTKLGKDEDFVEVLKEKINSEPTNERVELQDELWEKV